MRTTLYGDRGSEIQVYDFRGNFRAGNTPVATPYVYNNPFPEATLIGVYNYYQTGGDPNDDISLYSSTGSCDPWELFYTSSLIVSPTDRRYRQVFYKSKVNSTESFYRFGVNARTNTTLHSVGMYTLFNAPYEGITVDFFSASTEIVSSFNGTQSIFFNTSQHTSYPSIFYGYVNFFPMTGSTNPKIRGDVSNQGDYHMTNEGFLQTAVKTFQYCPKFIPFDRYSRGGSLQNINDTIEFYQYPSEYQLLHTTAVISFRGEEKTQKIERPDSTYLLDYSYGSPNTISMPEHNEGDLITVISLATGTLSNTTASVGWTVHASGSSATFNTSGLIASIYATSNSESLAGFTGSFLSVNVFRSRDNNLYKPEVHRTRFGSANSNGFRYGFASAFSTGSNKLTVTVVSSELASTTLKSSIYSNLLGSQFFEYDTPDISASGYIEYELSQSVSVHNISGYLSSLRPQRYAAIAVNSVPV